MPRSAGMRESGVQMAMLKKPGMAFSAEDKLCKYIQYCIKIQLWHMPRKYNRITWNS
jgi:hypothetical protein